MPSEERDPDLSQVRKVMIAKEIDHESSNFNRKG